MPLLLRSVVSAKQVAKALRTLGIRFSEVDRLYQANHSTLLVLKDESLCEVYPELILPQKEAKEIIAVHEYVERFKTLLEHELQAEIQAQEEEMRRLSGEERELFGRAILNLRAVKVGTKFHLHLVRFFREKPIETQTSTGDLVLVSQGAPLQSDLVGTVARVDERSITVAFEEKPPAWLFKRKVRLDLYVNDITFRRMTENLEYLRHIPQEKRRIRNVLLYLEKPRKIRKEKDVKIFNERLNEAQRQAVRLSLASQNFFLVHGPPGTGKTSTIAEVIFQLVREGHKVLATADTNVAVDNLLQKLLPYGPIRVVRIGHPARILEDLESYSIYAQLEKEVERLGLANFWDRIKKKIVERDRFEKPIPSLRRGLTDEEIIRLAKEKRGLRGLSRELIQSMARWIELNREISRAISTYKAKEAEIIKNLIGLAEVVLSTNSMVASEFLQGFEFDVAVIDEGSQQIEPSTLIPILRAKRFIIAGDHKQLPPVIQSEKAKELEQTLFERLIRNYPSLSAMLIVQYRMHEVIMGFSNENFYEGKLIADSSVARHTLADLGVSQPQRYAEILDPTIPLVFVDTSRADPKEYQPSGTTSFENPMEAELAVSLAEELLEMGLDGKAIGIITPYAGQLRLIKHLLLKKELKVEANTVDGFQGREKEVIILSFVRANPRGEIGFLKDYRRLNVALTRAKRKLILIGCAKTLVYDNMYAKLIDYVKEKGKYVEVEA